MNGRTGSAEVTPGGPLRCREPRTSRRMRAFGNRPRTSSVIGTGGGNNAWSGCGESLRVCPRSGDSRRELRQRGATRLRPMSSQVAPLLALQPQHSAVDHSSSIPTVELRAPASTVGGGTPSPPCTTTHAAVRRLAGETLASEERSPWCLTSAQSLRRSGSESYSFRRPTMRRYACATRCWTAFGQ